MDPSNVSFRQRAVLDGTAQQPPRPRGRVSLRPGFPVPFPARGFCNGCPVQSMLPDALPYTAKGHRHGIKGLSRCQLSIPASTEAPRLSGQHVKFTPGVLAKLPIAVLEAQHANTKQS